MARLLVVMCLEKINNKLVLDEIANNLITDGLCVQFTLGARGYAAMLAGTLCTLAVVRLALGVAPQFTADGTG